MEELEAGPLGVNSSLDDKVIDKEEVIEWLYEKEPKEKPIVRSKIVKPYKKKETSYDYQELIRNNGPGGITRDIYSRLIKEYKKRGLAEDIL